MKGVQIRVFSGPYFPVFGLNTGKYGLDRIPWDNFRSVSLIIFTKNLHRRYLTLTDIKMQNKPHHSMVANFNSHQNNILGFIARKWFAKRPQQSYDYKTLNLLKPDSTIKC